MQPQEVGHLVPDELAVEPSRSRTLGRRASFCPGHCRDPLSDDVNAGIESKIGNEGAAAAFDVEPPHGVGSVNPCCVRGVVSATSGAKVDLQNERASHVGFEPHGERQSRCDPLHEFIDGWEFMLGHRPILPVRDVRTRPAVEGPRSNTARIIIQAHQRNTRAMPPLDNRGRLAPPSDQREAERRPDPPQL